MSLLSYFPFSWASPPSLLLLCQILLSPQGFFSKALHTWRPQTFHRRSITFSQLISHHPVFAMRPWQLSNSYSNDSHFQRSLQLINFSLNYHFIWDFLQMKYHIIFLNESHFIRNGCCLNDHKCLNDKWRLMLKFTHDTNFEGEMLGARGLSNPPVPPPQKLFHTGGCLCGLWMLGMQQLDAL